MVSFRILAALLSITHLTRAVDSLAPPLPAPSGGSQGNSQDDDIFCKAYKDCGVEGLRYFNILQTTLMQASPVDRTDGLAKFLAAYVVMESEVSSGLKGLQSDLIIHGFDPNAIEAWETFSINPQYHLRDHYAAYDNYFDTVNGILIANANYNSLDSQKTLPWSEIMYQTWQTIGRLYRKGGPISNLRTVVQKTVVNRGTRAVLTTLYKTRQLSMNAGDRTWYKWTEVEEPQFFFALLGTDNIKGTIWLLNDHAAEIGKKEITEVWTRWPSTYPDVWIEIGHLD
ncbi:MAG: hypothetical protein LQ338_000647 [Usnochroma carphineum]|nr:MAG: hypothetical protein LQ338_000647 [Usnochroma carphineum]